MFQSVLTYRSTLAIIYICCFCQVFSQSPRHTSPWWFWWVALDTPKAVPSQSWCHNCRRRTFSTISSLWRPGCARYHKGWTNPAWGDFLLARATIQFMLINFSPIASFFCDMTMIRQSGQNSLCNRQVEATGIEIHWVLWSCSFPDSTVAQDGPARDLSVDVVITLYGMAAVLIYMMLIGDFMSDIVARLVLLPPPSCCISIREPWNIYHFISTYSTMSFRR